MKGFFEFRESKTVNLQEASTKVKTTMPDKVASSATRFGLKSKTQGGHVSISGPKGKLNDFLRAIIGRSSYGNASELSESVEEAYRKPTQAEIDADRRKDGKRKDTSSRYKNIKKKVYGNAMGGLKNESLSENIVQHPDHHKDYSSSDNRVGHHSGKLGKQSANLSQKQISQHSKAASDHDAAAKRHSDMAKKSKSSNAKHIHNSAAGAHTTAAIAHSDVISHAKRGSLVRGHVNGSYRMTANANDHTNKVPKSRKGMSESTTEQKMYSVKYTHPTDKKSGGTSGPLSKAAADKKAAMGNRVDKVGGKYTVIRHVAETSDAEVKRKQDFLDRLRGKPPVRDAVKKKASTNESVQESTMSDRRVVRAMRIAKDMAGNHTGATRAIEKLKKGLSNHPKVKDALRTHNESVRSADKKPQNFRDPETGKTKVRMVPVDRDIASRKTNESVELDEAKYNKGAVDKEIKKDRRIKGKEAKAIHSLLKGRTPRKEEVEPIAENYRTLATHGMGAETKNSINVGRDVDYYEPKNGDKRQGRITKMTRSGYVVKDEGNGKSHSFAFHDRAKAKEIMAKNK